VAYRPGDAYYRRAKKEGYASRAAYKLVEINRRFRLFGRGSRVVDLGASPGGWLQIAAREVGPSGAVVGVDLQPLDRSVAPNVRFLRADATDPETAARVLELLGSRADCVLSDLAPRLSGIRDADVRRSLELARSALGLATRVLAAGGSFLVKAFQSDELDAFVAELGRSFRTVHRTRPEATRRGSSEIYAIGKGFQPTARHESG
jgi:23S rRNA (uridine2552-2'-O)-methyltransferase